MGETVKPKSPRETVGKERQSLPHPQAHVPCWEQLMRSPTHLRPLHTRWRVSPVALQRSVSLSPARTVCVSGDVVTSEHPTAAGRRYKRVTQTCGLSYNRVFIHMHTHTHAHTHTHTHAQTLTHTHAHAHTHTHTHTRTDTHTHTRTRTHTHTHKHTTHT